MGESISPDPKAGNLPRAGRSELAPSPRSHKSLKISAVKLDETRSNYLTVGHDKKKVLPTRPSGLFANKSMLTPALGGEESKLKQKRAASLHQSMIMRSATRQWK